MTKSNLSDKVHRRLNPLTNEWVLVSPHRTKRPWQGKQEQAVISQDKPYDSSCYLCPTNTRNNGIQNPDYSQVFVFDNDYAAILPDEENWDLQKGLLSAKGELGICKVICFSPNHSLTLPEMKVGNIQRVVAEWQQQFNALAQLDHIHNVQIFENKGAIMGCSNPHPHGQIWAQNSIPQEIAKRTATQQAYFSKYNKSLLDSYIKQEEEAGERIVDSNEFFVALVPFWAIWPYEVMIVPKRHFQTISQMTEAEISGFAQILKSVTIRYDNLFNTSFPYSAGMQQAPTDGQGHEGWHFHYSFYPPLLRSASVKKFMVGYEMFANPQRDITAEQAAETLRNVSTLHYKQQ